MLLQIVVLPLVFYQTLQVAFPFECLVLLRRPHHVSGFRHYAVELVVPLIATGLLLRHLLAVNVGVAGNDGVAGLVAGVVVRRHGVEVSVYQFDVILVQIYCLL